MIRKKMKNMKPIDWMLITIVILLPISLVLHKFKMYDNDLWYLLSEGRYILHNGVYHIDPLSMHEGLDIVVQNWLSAVIFWIVYSICGSKGILATIFITNIVISYLLYKICMLISDKNKMLSILVTLFADINIVLYYGVSRPQIFSFVIMLLLIYLLELYIKKNDTKYLRFIPLLSLLWINLHASLWLYLVLIMIPYIIDSFKNEKLMLQGYRTKPLVITLVVSILIALINPYGYKAMTFIFNSYGDKFMHSCIWELHPFSFDNMVCINFFGVIALTMLLYLYFRKGTIRVRYICLYFGTLILGMNTVKAFSHFLIVAIFPLALLLKDIFPREFKKNTLKREKISNIIMAILTIATIGFTIYIYCHVYEKLDYKNSGAEAVDSIEMFAKDYPATVYTSFDDGGYISFRGYKPYIDPRAEVYLKKNNHKADIYKEFYTFESGEIDIDEFTEKYNFDFIFIRKKDRLYKEESINNYFIIYDDAETGYKVYARNNIIDDDVRELIIEEYEKSKKKDEQN